ncbi:hypothetical protein OKW30_000621 [Paraburkholderia sp. Clong3]|uniref:hypothetical protein n=1 Tax=Paraburkholderia sp. Clong3 TaxID=2991061 RepID=UPI003D1AD9F5
MAEDLKNGGAGHAVAMLDTRLSAAVSAGRRGAVENSARLSRSHARLRSKLLTTLPPLYSQSINVRPVQVTAFTGMTPGDIRLPTGETAGSVIARAIFMLADSRKITRGIESGSQRMRVEWITPTLTRP